MRPPLGESWFDQAFDDLVRLADLDRAVAEAALCAVEDLTHHRKRGKELGPRRVSGDLTGLYRIKFDVPGMRPERFRLVYEL